MCNLWTTDNLDFLVNIINFGKMSVTLEEVIYLGSTETPKILPLNLKKVRV